MNIGTVLVAGEIFIDLLMTNLDAWPEPGKEIFATSFQREIGGGTAITASALARLGCECDVLAAVGEDYGEWARNRLQQCNVRTDSIRTDKEDATGFTVIASRPEDRAFITYLGANRRFPEILRNWLRSAVKAPKHVHFSVPLRFEEGRDSICAITGRGATVSLDVGWNQHWLSDERAWDVARAANIFFPNELEGMHMTGEIEPAKMLQVFANRKFQHVVLKLGPKGAAMLWEGHITFENPIRIQCGDTTGAGDCFDAGFLQAWLSGAEPIRCLRAANICGALSTTAHGGIAGAPDLELLRAELRKLEA